MSNRKKNSVVTTRLPIRIYYSFFVKYGTQVVQVHELAFYDNLVINGFIYVNVEAQFKWAISKFEVIPAFLLEITMRYSVFS